MPVKPQAGPRVIQVTADQVPAPDGRMQSGKP